MHRPNVFDPLIVIAAALAFALLTSGLPVSVRAQQTEPPELSHHSYLPYVSSADLPTPTSTSTPVPDQTPLPERQWDPRLDVRGAVLIPAEVEPGQGYWRLVKAVWYDENEPPFAGQHHIFADVLDEGEAREVGIPLRISDCSGSVEFAMIITELKPGELYAANFPMYALAPAYRAVPHTEAPADAVSGMGYGCLNRPEYACHTSYGLVWQWAVVPEPTAESTPTATPTATVSGELPGALAPAPTPTATPAATPEPMGARPALP